MATKKDQAAPESWKEKRVFPRKTMRTQVILEDEFGDGFIYFYTTDVSLGGLFIESEIPLRIGTKMFLSFTLPAEAPRLIRTTGEVVRVERLTTVYTGVSGLGIRFIDLPEADRNAIEAFARE